ncbi:Winged helix DNA-binding domain-containing protein [Streptomyces sp. DvalAA-14]|uniref:DNA glycosylase AlkZ-like family protein n=1 Tax=unclassified Streptomyces TaxID=2593676 RepID=UPI00081B835B|nr:MULTISPECIES: crosslink repair DNA glycosylase YcaQ family protein [unclassified Streptomyces]MYS21365.1 winged helix DNA-binding domain-containing protein [Streptomyces sp. SID4948]SCD90569.1 Winged helix DNA-binding domain-containing protein [Streptomyces sp. DvalAA-14]
MRAQAVLIGVEERRARVRARQLAKVADVGGVVDGLVALHATDPATVFLSVAARLRRPHGVFTAVEEALYGSGPASPPRLVRMLAMRRTMFVVGRERAPEVFAAAGRDIAVRERGKLLAYLAEGGGWDAGWLAEVEAEVEAALDRHGDSSGAQLSRLVPRLREQVVVARGKPYEATQNVASRVIRTMAAEYRIERRRPAGSWTSSQFRWARAQPLPDRPVGQARAAVVRAWLRAYGPATEADAKWWTGWTLAEVRKALKAVDAEPVRLDEAAGQPGWVLPGDTGPTQPPPLTALLLPGLDPTPMGWQDRDWFLPRTHRDALFDGTGNVGPTVWWGGEVIGGWAQRPDGAVVWRQLTDRGATAARAADTAAAELTELLGGVRITPRFRTPLERELSA